ncbi:MAG: T9SS type A sorting domain-containing protein [Bacteroidota bacterium]
MQHATRHLLLGTALLLAAPAWAQSDVVFQVDMNTAIERCAFTPGESEASVPGSFNEFNTGADLLNDDGTNGDATAGDGIYSTTLSLADGPIEYKFWGTDPLGWEDNQSTDSGNREFEVEGPATLPVADYFKADGISDQCDAALFEVIFEVDMSVQALIGDFDPETDIVTVAGEFINGWNNAADTLVQDPFNPDIYVGLVEVELTAPSTQNYKYIIGEPEDAAPDGWESGENRTFEVTGDETDQSGNGIPEVNVPVRFFNDLTPDQILTEDATVVFEVDLRPAYYFLEDNGLLPADTQTGQTIESLDGLFINGPVSNGDGLTDWATWGEDLAAISTRELLDDGTQGDVTAGDSVFSITYTYTAGSPKALVGKHGVNGFDNEGGFGADQNFAIEEGQQTVRSVFGAVLQNDGTYTDDSGPNGPGGDFSQAYDPYALIDNDADPATVVAVRSGGEADNEPSSVEGTGVVPVAAELRGNYPNPFVGRTTFEYALPESGAVHLAVYDLTGRLVAVLVDAVQTADTYRVSFDAAGLASGVYLTRLRAGDAVFSQRLTVLN